MDKINTTNYHNLTRAVFSLKKGGELAFEKVALDVFKLQYDNNDVYRAFVEALRVNPDEITSIYQIPFLPIEMFKTKRVLTDAGILTKPIVFTSSGTSQTGTSFHYVSDLDLYEESFLKSFELFYGKPSDYCFLVYGEKIN